MKRLNVTNVIVVPAILCGTLAIALGTPLVACRAQVAAQMKLPPEPTFNLFSIAADIAIGKASAEEAERQLTTYVDPPLSAHVNRVVARLAAAAPGAKFPYIARLIDAPEVNAFSMPGGPIFVTRGLLSVVETEPELAAVLAHEMAHIALRHGTDNASRLYLARSGLGILGGLQGDRSWEPTQMINEVGGVGLNHAFVKFLDDEEYDADAAGAQIMARAGYDPNVIAAFLSRIRTLRLRDSVSYARLIAGHPVGTLRDDQLRKLTATLTYKPSPEIGGFAELRARIPVAATATSLSGAWPLERKDSTRTQTGQVSLVLPMPSARMLSFRHHTGFFTVNRPADWWVSDSMPGFGVVFAPVGGLATLPNGARTVVHGIIVNHYAPFDGPTERAKRSLKQHFAPLTFVAGHRAILDDATDDLVRVIMWTSPHLSAPVGSARPLTIDNAPAYAVLLTGLSPLTGEEERVLVYTRALPDDHVVFMLCVAPARNFELLEPTFERMAKSLNVNEASVHAGTSLLLQGR